VKIRPVGAQFHADRQTNITKLIAYKYKRDQSITQHFMLYTIKIVYCQGDVPRPLLGHPQALLRKQIQELSIFQ